MLQVVYVSSNSLEGAVKCVCVCVCVCVLQVRQVSILVGRIGRPISLSCHTLNPQSCELHTGHMTLTCLTYDLQTEDLLHLSNLLRVSEVYEFTDLRDKVLNKVLTVTDSHDTIQYVPSSAGTIQ